MNNYDHILTGYGIDLGYWMDAQSEPEFIYTSKEEVKIKIACWLNHMEDPNSEAIDAPYDLIISF